MSWKIPASTAIFFKAKVSASPDALGLIVAELALRILEGQLSIVRGVIGNIGKRMQ